jgi:hypothetical protein
MKPMLVSKGGAELSSKFNLFNRGKSPATGVLIFMRLMAFPREEGAFLNYAGKVKAAVEQDLDQGRTKRFGVTIFPREQPVEDSATAELGEAEITAARGEPPGQVEFYLGVGVRYRFGRQLCRTISVYNMLLLGGDLDFDNAETSIHPDNVELMDCLHGYAT